MKIKSISFSTVWEDNPSIENQNMDVFVESEDGYTYVLVVATRKNIEYLMDQEKKNYFRPGIPFIMVKEFTKEIIEETVQAYAEDEDVDEYWLKAYHFAGEIDKSVFDKLQAEDTEEDLNEAELIKKYLNKLDELNNS